MPDLPAQQGDYSQHSWATLQHARLLVGHGPVRRQHRPHHPAPPARGPLGLEPWLGRGERLGLVRLERPDVLRQPRRQGFRRGPLHGLGPRDRENSTV